MRNLSDLLKRFVNSLDRDVLQKETIARVIEEKTRVRLNPEGIRLKEGVLHITTASAGKSEINLKQEAILQDLKNIHNLSIKNFLYH